MSELTMIYCILWLVGCALVGWNSQKLWLGMVAITIIAAAWNVHLYEATHPQPATVRTEGK